MDKMGSVFTNSQHVKANNAGEIILEPSDFRSLIGRARPNRKAAFLIPEFDEFGIDLKIGMQKEKIVVESGVGESPVKEEWRDTIVGNLFFPAEGTKFKPIVHLNGSVQLLQDSRWDGLVSHSEIVMAN